VLELCRSLICPNSAFAVFQRGSGADLARSPLHWTEALSGREWATLVWVGIALAFILGRSDLRSSAFNVVRSALQRKLLTTAAIMLAYIAIVVYAAWHIELWNVRLLGATLAWIAASALAGFFRVLKIPKESNYFCRAVRKSVAVTVLVDAYVSFAPLPFIAELFFLPFVTFLLMLTAVAEAKNEFASIRGFLNGTVGLIGIGLLVYATVHIIKQVFASSLSQLGKSLILPMWLNLTLIPFSYLIAVWMAYEITFLFLGFAPNATRESLRRAKLALLLDVGLRVHSLGDFGPPWPYRFSNATTLDEARHVARVMRMERASLAAEKAVSARA